MTFPRKILVSPNYGAGWSTWGEPAQFAAEYQPIIEYLENGGVFVEKASADSKAPQYENFEEPGQSVLKQFYLDLAEHENKDIGDVYFYLGGADDLIVVEVNGPYRIDEYDGFESVVQAVDETWFT